MKNLFKAIAAFQSEAPIIHKGSSGYGYSYASLPDVIEKITPLLTKHNIGFTQLGDGDKVKTIIFHTESGEHLESVFNIPSDVKLSSMNPFQVLGSAITYIRRYALASALGLVTDVDNDANGNTDKGNKSLDKGNAPAQDNKAWFNPTDKAGNMTDAGKAWIAYMKEHGKEKAKEMALNKYKASKAVREWMDQQ